MNRDMLMLAASYFCINFVFYMFSQWLFTYLVEVARPLDAGERLALCAAFRDGRRP